MNKKSLVAPILISMLAFIAVPVSVSAVTQRASEINVCVDWDTKEVKYSKYWEKCPARHTTMTLGSEGPAGRDGADGKDGRDGRDGSGGSGVGPQGPAGRDGADGADGADGRVGLTGAQGAIGARGADGEDGAQGAIGERGATGATGATGPAGATGVDVFKGVWRYQGFGSSVESWNLPADGPGVWSYTVMLQVQKYSPSSAVGSCQLFVEDEFGMQIGSSFGEIRFVVPEGEGNGVGFGTGVAWVEDHEAAALENRDINVEPYFELACDTDVPDMETRATITMVQASDYRTQPMDPMMVP